MKRPLARSFFWLDQNLVREGIWFKLKPPARMAYVAISASVDRQGLSVWSRSKLMYLAGSGDAEQFEESLNELQEQGLIERLSERNLPAIQLCSLTQQTDISPEINKNKSITVVTPSKVNPPISIHTHIHWGGTPHVESQDSN